MTTRQRDYQLKMVSEGKCRICGKEAVTKAHCQLHREMHNKANREYLKRRKGK